MPVAILSITRALPPSVAQTRRDSCWAAVLESWTRVAKQVQIMDPAGGRYLVRDFAWFEQQPAGLVMMRH